MERADQSARSGVMAGVLAFSMWGALPIYFIVAEGVSAIEMLLHRVVWAVPFGALIIFARRQWPDVKAALASRRTFGLLVFSIKRDDFCLCCLATRHTENPYRQAFPAVVLPKYHMCMARGESS